MKDFYVSKHFKSSILTMLLLLTLAVLFGRAEVSVASAATVTESGTCGTCSWELDDEGLLRIYPKDGVSGTLASISSLSGWPWYNFRKDVKKVQFDEGVSGNSQCGYIFYEMTRCTEVNYPA